MAMRPVQTADDFLNSTNVSRETLGRLQAYADLLVKWQNKINLIGPKTLPDIWQRHFLDSAQLVAHCPVANSSEDTRRLVDLGSGAGFPGLVLCILTGMETHLVESDSRKAAFLREAGRVAGVSDRLTVHAKRAEAVEIGAADVISARALAPLADLLPLAERFWKKETIALFPKGKRFKEELTEAKYGWYINCSVVESKIDPDSVLLVLTDLIRKEA